MNNNIIIVNVMRCKNSVRVVWAINIETVKKQANEKVWVRRKNMDGIKLELLDLKYSKQLLKLWGNENVMKYTYLDTLDNVEQVEYRVNFWLKEHTSKTLPNNFVVMLEDEVVGVAGFPIIKKNPFHCGMYYQIMEEFQGKGIATAVVEKMLCIIYEKYPDAKIIASCTASNMASKRVLIKNGFIYSDLKKEAFERNGLVDDVEKYVFIKKI